MEPSHGDIKNRFKAVTEELEGRLSPQGISSAWQNGGDFDALTRERREVLAEQKRLRPIALGEEIVEVRQQLGDAIARLIQESDLEELLGEPVRNVVYYDGDIGGLDINVELQQPQAPVKSQVRETDLLPRGVAANRSGRKPTTFIVENGEALTAMEYIERHGTDRDRDHSYYRTQKFPTKLARAIYARKHNLMRLSDDEVKAYLASRGEG